MTAPCKVAGCSTPRRSRCDGYCFADFTAFCRRAGSMRCEALSQQLADLLAQVDYEVIGKVRVVDMPVWDGTKKAVKV